VCVNGRRALSAADLLFPRPLAQCEPVLPPIRISRLTARRFQRRSLLLDQSVATVDAALAHHGYIQIDPINVCGRMHDLILRNRVSGYREGDLMLHLHGATAPHPSEHRTAFEHHVPDTNILVAFPLAAWPYLQEAMHRRARSTGSWSGRLTPRERSLGEHILSEIAAHGALSSDAIDDDRQARRVWGSATLAKSTLQKLFFHGRVLISHRLGQRRVYDLPERVLPPSVRNASKPSAKETSRWLALLKLRQRRLVTLKREELKIIEDLVQPIEITDPSSSHRCPPLFCLKDDVAWLDGAGGEISAQTDTLRLLAPLDPIIYDRRVTSALWDFDYTWEAYTPPHKRVRGYYAMPVLAGLEIVGHVDAKADRKIRRLRIVSRRIRRGHRVASATRAFAQWLGLR
jgi:uncharacterized protein YcaQ